MPTYAEKLRDPRWQRKRLEILEKHEFTCELCAATDKPLHIHHVIYEKGKNPWDYEDNFLRSLCEDCHKKIANLQIDLMSRIAQYPVDMWEELVDAIDGLDKSQDHPFVCWYAWMKQAEKLRTGGIAALGM